MTRRLHGMGQPNYRNGFKLTLQPHMLDRPLRWRRPQMIFVNSMSDLFHKDVPVECPFPFPRTPPRPPRNTRVPLPVGQRSRQAANQADARARWRNPGSLRSKGSARAKAPRSSSNSGEAATRSSRAASSKDEPGTECRRPRCRSHRALGFATSLRSPFPDRADDRSPACPTHACAEAETETNTVVARQAFFMAAEERSGRSNDRGLLALRWPSVFGRPITEVGIRTQSRD